MRIVILIFFALIASNYSYAVSMKCDKPSVDTIMYPPNEKRSPEEAAKKLGSDIEEWNRKYAIRNNIPVEDIVYVIKSKNKTSKLVYLYINGYDPSDLLMEKLESKNIQKGSLSKDKKQLYESYSGFYKCENNLIKVIYKYGCGPECFEHGYIFVKQKNDEWTITSEVRRGIT